jgi:Nucleotidyltransferase substrate binding protein like
MIERKLQDSLANLERATKKLESALLIPKERELVVEGTIQRFEMVVELVWKTLKLRRFPKVTRFGSRRLTHPHEN